MNIDKNMIKRLAFTSRINLDDRIEAEISKLLKFIKDVEVLENLDLKNIRPMVSPLETSISMREDVVDDGEIEKDILANAKTEYGYFVVPKVVE